MTENCNTLEETISLYSTNPTRWIEKIRGEELISIPAFQNETKSRG